MNNYLPEGYEVVSDFSGVPEGYQIVPSKSVGGFLTNAATDAKDVARGVYKAVSENPKKAATDTLDYMVNPKTYLKSVGESISNLWGGGLDRAYEHPAQTAMDVLNVAPPVGPAAIKGVSVASKAPSLIPKRIPKSLIPEGNELLQRGGLEMKIAKLDPAKVEASALAGPMQRFRERLKSDAVELDPQFVPQQIMNQVRRLEGAYAPPKRGAMANVTKIEPQPNAPVSLGELHSHKQRLNKFVNEGAGKTNGRINEHGRIALELKKTIDEMIAAHPMSGTFKSGSSKYHAGAMSRSFDEIKKDASLTAQWRNGNEAAALQNATANFLKAKKNKYAFTPEIRKQLAAFAHDKKGRLLSAFGSKTVSGIAAGRLVESAFGHPGVLWGPGMIAREARTKRLMADWDRISELIRSGE